MNHRLLGIVVALVVPVGVAFAQDPIANMTTTSMGAPFSSPNYAAPRSVVVPGLPAQEREMQRIHAGHGRQLQASVGEINSSPLQSPPAI